VYLNQEIDEQLIADTALNHIIPFSNFPVGFLICIINFAVAVMFVQYPKQYVIYEQKCMDKEAYSYGNIILSVVAEVY
jgi:hypothetical protein